MVGDTEETMQERPNQTSGFTPVRLYEILANTQHLGNKHFSDSAIAHVGNSFEETIEDRLGSSSGSQTRVTLDPTVNNAYMGRIVYQPIKENKDSSARFLNFTADFLEMMITQLGCGCLLEGKAKENIRAELKNFMRDAAREENWGIQLNYFLDPSLASISLSRTKKPLEGRIGQYAFSELSSGDFGFSNYSSVTINGELNAGIRDGCSRILYDDSVTCREERYDDPLRIGSMLDYLKKCISVSEKAHDGDFGGAAAPLLKFLDAYTKVAEQRPLLLSREKQIMMDELYTKVFDLVATYGAMDSLGGTRKIIEYGKGKPLDPEEVRLLKEFSGGSITVEELGNLEAGRDLTEREAVKYNPGLHQSEVARIKKEINGLMGAMAQPYGSSEAFQPSVRELPGEGVMILREQQIH